MPILAEREKDGGKRRQRWLPGLLVLPVLLLGLLLIPCVYPLEFGIGSYWLSVDGTVEPSSGPAYPQGWMQEDTTRFVDHELGFRWHTFLIAGAFHYRCFRVGRWSYEVAWFRGRRVP